MELTEEMKELHNRKNAGYAGDSPDPFLNFRQAEAMGVSAFKGCLIRMSDKFSRICSLSKNPNNDKVNEAITDTLMDMAVYSLIAICLYEEKQKKEEENNARGITSGNERGIINEKTERLICSQETDIKNSAEHSKTEVFSGWRADMDRRCK
jgi:hypothetical protein